jgi:hypothetical protein
MATPDVSMLGRQGRRGYDFCHEAKSGARFQARGVSEDGFQVSNLTLMGEELLRRFDFLFEGFKITESHITAVDIQQAFSLQAGSGELLNIRTCPDSTT